MKELLSNILIKKYENLSLRPAKLDQFIGQDSVTELLKIYILAANTRGEILRHVLIHGDSGLGKRLLAETVGREIGRNNHFFDCTKNLSHGDLAALYSSCDSGDIIIIQDIELIDEISEKITIEAMKNFNFEIQIGSGEELHSIKVDLHPITVIATTTQIDKIKKSLRNQFDILLKIEKYTIKDLEIFVKKIIEEDNISITNEAIIFIVENCDGNPSLAKLLIKHTLDFAIVLNKGNISKEICEYALRKMIENLII